jgi:hypothetical protein
VVHQVVALQGPLVEVQDLQVVVETVAAADAPEEVNKIPTFSIYKNLFCSPLAKREDFFLTTVKAYAVTGYIQIKMKFKLFSVYMRRINIYAI